MRNKLLFSNNCIEIQCDRGDEETRRLVMSFYPVHANRIGTSFKVSAHLAPEVLKLFRGLDESNINTAPQKIQSYFYKEIYARQHVDDLIKHGPKESKKVSDTLTLTTHQQLGREIAKYHDRFAFFYDTRTGKTPLSLAIINDDIQAHANHKWLVICPLILVKNAWLVDIERFLPTLSVKNCWAPTKDKRLAAIADKSCSVYITNTESFITYREYIKELNIHGCIVDESSDMKSPKSKVSKEIVDFAQYMRRFYLLSGTPAPNGEWEYYMQMRAIDYYGWQPSYAQFKEYYFVNLSYNPQFEKLALRPDRKDDIINKVKQTALYVDKEDVLNTPGREFHRVEFKLPDKLREQYNQLKNELYLEIEQVDTLDGTTILAKSAATKLNKLNQVTSGFVLDTQAAIENRYYEDKKPEWYLLDRYRFDMLQNILAGKEKPNGIDCSGQQVIIWANYRREFELIKEMLGDSCGLVYGGASITEKNDAIARFKSGALQYLVANPASADKGLTLTNCHTAIYFSLNWSYELFKQSCDRIYGDKTIQPYFCNYLILIAKGTIDKILYDDVLQSKGEASYAILNHLKSEGEEL